MIGKVLDVMVNVVLDADSLSLQTQIVSEGGIYALLALTQSLRRRRSAGFARRSWSRRASHRARNAASGRIDTRMENRDAGGARGRCRRPSSRRWMSY
jgi:hypothetical protein